MKTETPFKTALFYSCLCHMSRTMMILSMLLLTMKFYHVVPHSTLADEKKNHVTNFHIERSEEEIEEEPEHV